MHLPVCKTCGRATGDVISEGAGDLWAKLRSPECVLPAVALGVIGALIEVLSSGNTALAMGWSFVIVWVIYASCVFGTFFGIVAHIGAGRPGMPHAIDLEDLPAMFGRMGRGVVCFGIGAAPAIAWVIVKGGDDVTMVGLLLVAGQLYVPAVLVSVTVNDHTGNALWPPSWVQTVARAPVAYARFAALWVVTVFVGGAIVAALESVLVDAVPVAGEMAAATLGLLFFYAQAILVGQFLRKNAAALGW